MGLRTLGVTLLVAGLWMFISPFLGPRIGIPLVPAQLAMSSATAHGAAAQIVPASASATPRASSMKGMAMKGSAAAAAGGAVVGTTTTKAATSNSAATSSSMSAMMMARKVVLDRAEVFDVFLPSILLLLVGMFLTFGNQAAVTANRRALRHAAVG